MRFLLLHLASTLHLLVAIAILALRNIDRVKVDVVVGTDVRVADDVQLELVCALGQRYLKLHRQVLRHSHPLDRVQRPRRRVTNDQPPVRELLDGEVGRDDSLIVLAALLVFSVLRQRDGDVDRVAGDVVALGNLVRDVERGVRVDESRNVAPIVYMSATIRRRCDWFAYICRASICSSSLRLSSSISMMSYTDSTPASLQRLTTCTSMCKYTREC